METQVFNHLHPMVPKEEKLGKESMECNGCHEQISSAPFYSCNHCNYFLHDYCARIKHFSHPQHALRLKQQSPPNFVYLPCFGCRKQIMGFYYHCSECKFNLHKSCGELPRKMRHHFHPEHPLFLLRLPPSYLHGECLCVACNRFPISFTYHCFQCRFDLDIGCAVMPPSLESGEHEHPLTLVRKPASFKCDSCGSSAEGMSLSYFCFTCQYWIHLKCVASPSSDVLIIRQAKVHEHPLNIGVISLFSDVRSKFVPLCVICKKGLRRPSSLVLLCDSSSCTYCAHVGCVLPREKALMRSLEYIEFPYPGRDDLPRTTSVLPSEELFEVANLEHDDEDINLGRNKRSAKELIKHFSHPHDMQLVEEEEEMVYKNCDLCRWTIFPPFYSCTRSTTHQYCNVFLHASCAKLEQQQKKNNHFLRQYCHHDELIISLREEDFASCKLCDKAISEDFMYKCPECNLKLHLRCSALRDKIKHPSHHHHPLFHVEGTPSTHHCIACGENCRGTTYVCTLCDYYLEAKCASLPLTARHSIHKHILTLVTHPAENELGQYVCDDCEDQHRNPHHWYYNCEVCDYFSVHVKCIEPIESTGGASFAPLPKSQRLKTKWRRLSSKQTPKSAASIFLEYVRIINEMNQTSQKS